MKLTPITHVEELEVRREPTQVSDADLQALRSQLERPARGVIGIAARCACGRPLVVKTSPRLENGEPFPTVFYLTQPAATSAVGRLESEGTMASMSARLAEDTKLAQAYREAHIDYLRRRSELGVVPEIDGVSAGGMPTRVKCLHVLVGHALAAGPGINPLGDETLVLLSGWWRPDVCFCRKEKELP